MRRSQFTKFLSFLKQQISFPSIFLSILSDIKLNFSVLSKLKHYILWGQNSNSINFSNVLTNLKLRYRYYVIYLWKVFFLTFIWQEYFILKKIHFLENYLDGFASKRTYLSRHDVTLWHFPTCRKRSLIMQKMDF